MANATSGHMPQQLDRSILVNHISRMFYTQPYLLAVKSTHVQWDIATCGTNHWTFISLTIQYSLADCRIPKLTMFCRHPKPDLYLAIQIHKSVPASLSFLNHALQNFTFEALSSCKGLDFSPTQRPANIITKDYHHQVAFPFCIVEAKRVDDKKPEEECYCQAANAASAALAMLVHLSEYGSKANDRRERANEILPVFCLTFIGPEVKVWLAYLVDGEAQNRSYQCVSMVSVFLSNRSH